MLTPLGRDLDPSAAINHYTEHGYASLGRIVEESFLQELRTRADDIMLGRVQHEGLFFQHESESGRYEDLPYGKGYVGPSLSYRKIEKLERDPLFRSLIENTLFERIARQVIEGDVVIYRAVLFTKPQVRSSPLPFHQDGGQFWGLDRDPVLQVWLAIDDAPADGGCVEVLAGSHQNGLATPLGGVVPADHVERERADGRTTRLPVSAGEGLLLHNHVWHRSGPSLPGHVRRAFTVCYMTASTRCRRKKRAPRVFVPVFSAAGR